MVFLILSKRSLSKQAAKTGVEQTKIHSPRCPGLVAMTCFSRTAGSGRRRTSEQTWNRWKRRICFWEIVSAVVVSSCHFYIFMMLLSFFSSFMFFPIPNHPFLEIQIWHLPFNKRQSPSLHSTCNEVRFCAKRDAFTTGHRRSNLWTPLLLPIIKQCFTWTSNSSNHFIKSGN